jgi:hypothetical protein
MQVRRRRRDQRGATAKVMVTSFEAVQREGDPFSDDFIHTTLSQPLLHRTDVRPPPYAVKADRSASSFDVEIESGLMGAKANGREHPKKSRRENIDIMIDGHPNPLCSNPVYSAKESIKGRAGPSRGRVIEHPQILTPGFPEPRAALREKNIGLKAQSLCHPTILRTGPRQPPAAKTQEENTLPTMGLRRNSVTAALHLKIVATELERIAQCHDSLVLAGQNQKHDIVAQKMYPRHISAPAVLQTAKIEAANKPRQAVRQPGALRRMPAMVFEQGISAIS